MLPFRTAARITLAVILVGVAGYLLYAQRRQLAMAVGDFRHLRWWWIPPAMVCESASMVSLARMQRRLLGAGGVHFAARSAIATTYAGNAISVSLPLAGPEVGTTYQYRAFRRFGADPEAAGWDLAVSGVVSTLALALVLTAGAVASGNRTAAVVGAALGAVVAVPVILMIWALRRPGWRQRLEHITVAVLTWFKRLVRWPRYDVHELVATAFDKIAVMHLSRLSWAMVGWLGLANWLADVGCLACVMIALGVAVPWAALLLAWGAGAGAASLGFTPGGLGTVEAVLAAALVAAGLPGSAALGSVLIYRLISFWLVLGVGWIVFYFTYARRPAGTPDGPARPSPQP